ncbi:DUF4349 domain-containing protein [[Eubacterium] cellulosolvens]
MRRSKILVISSVVVILLLASFFIGMLYSPYGPVGVETPPAVMPKAETELAYSSRPGAQPTPQERLVIYNAYLSLETGDIQGGLGMIRRLAEDYGGYVASSSRSTYGMQSRAEMAIRVPKDKFHAAVQEIETYGKVLDESTTSEDITQQYIDLKARLNNLQKQEERLHEVLDMAKTVDEILKVESELARVRGEIDSLQGQINYLEGNVEMSLISVELIEPAPPFTPPGMDWGETFEIAIVGFFTVLRGMIILAVSLIPLAAVGVPAYYVYKRRKLKKE